MPLTCRILGQPGRDNALLVECVSGQAHECVLFDCGGGCLDPLALSQLQRIDHLCLSHLHMDHIAGFDTFFRANFNRTSVPNRVWGPPDTARILHHRFQGYLWNLHAQLTGSWTVTDVTPTHTQATRFELAEAFAHAHPEPAQPSAAPLIAGAGYAVTALTMDHRTPTLAYFLQERPRVNVATERLVGLGLRPGPWLQQLKEPTTTYVTIAGTDRSAAELRAQLLVETPGQAVAYLTDFLLDENAQERLAHFLLLGVQLVCETQYAATDAERAAENHHMTTVAVAALAQRVQAKDLVLFHLSDRYDSATWRAMLGEAQQIFPAARYPEHWELS